MNIETTFDKLNFLRSRGWTTYGKKTGKVFYRTAPYPKPISINDALWLEERCDAIPITPQANAETQDVPQPEAKQ